MNIVITGASSFIGRELVKALATKGNKVYAVVRKNCDKVTNFKEIENIKIIYLDMKDYSRLNLCISESVDVFCTLAWDGTRGNNRNDTCKQKNNYLNSMEGIYAAISLGCKTIITAGSQAEYGDLFNSFREEHNCRPNTAYGQWKLKYYNTIKKICEDKIIKVIEPRFFSLYGHQDSKDTLIMYLIEMMKKNSTCYIKSAGNQTWNYLYIDDAVRGIVQLIQNDAEAGVYNFCSSDVRQLKEFIWEIKETLQSKSKIVFDESNGIKDHNLEGTNEKLKKAVNWEERYTFKKGIQEISELSILEVSMEGK